MRHAFLARAVACTAAALASLAGAAVAGAQATDTDFAWNGAVNRGNWVHVRNVNGAVLVEAGTGSQVEITAIKRAKDGGDPQVVRIEAKHSAAGGDVIVCALWWEDGVCDIDDYESGKRRGKYRDDEWRDRGNVSVEFRVKLPAGVKVNATTVNGRVRIDGATAEVVATTVNGGIEAVSTGGPVRATSVNGNIDVRMATLGGESVDYTTVNGSVTVRLPANANAEVEMTTVNGSLESDFPLTLQGRMDRRHIRARLGTGGPRLTFRTVNGSVQLVRS